MGMCLSVQVPSARSDAVYSDSILDSMLESPKQQDSSSLTLQELLKQREEETKSRGTWARISEAMQTNSALTHADIENDNYWVRQEYDTNLQYRDAFLNHESESEATGITASIILQGFHKQCGFEWVVLNELRKQSPAVQRVADSLMELSYDELKNLSTGSADIQDTSVNLNIQCTCTPFSQALLSSLPATMRTSSVENIADHLDGYEQCEQEALGSYLFFRTKASWDSAMEALDNAMCAARHSTASPLGDENFLWFEAYVADHIQRFGNFLPSDLACFHTIMQDKYSVTLTCPVSYSAEEDSGGDSASQGQARTLSDQQLHTAGHLSQETQQPDDDSITPLAHRTSPNKVAHLRTGVFVVAKP